jgi:hypothetical protein
LTVISFFIKKVVTSAGDLERKDMDSVRFLGWFRPFLYSFISLISVSVLVYSDLDRTSDRIRASYRNGTEEEDFDFIVGKSTSSIAHQVRARTGGCLLVI